MYGFFMTKNGIPKTLKISRCTSTLSQKFMVYVLCGYGIKFFP